MGGIFRHLFGSPSPTDIQIWHCEPLVIQSNEDGIVFAGKADVEFEPDPGNPQLGNVRANIDLEGWQPAMSLTSRVDMPMVADPQRRVRGGFLVFGVAGEGNSFTWHVDGAADQILIDQERPNEAVPSLHQMGKERLAAMNAKPIENEDAEDWFCEPLAIIDDEGVVAFSGDAVIGVASHSNEFRWGTAFARFVTEDGWRPCLHIVEATEEFHQFRRVSLGWTFAGYDTDGAAFVWLTGEVATDELTRRQLSPNWNEPE